MEDKPQKIQKIWPLPDPPPHPEMTMARTVKPDNIKPGELLMVVCSSAVRLEMTPMGPIVKRIDNDPTFGGVMSVREYCYPFIACIVITGKWAGTRMALDVRRHKLVKVTQRFARSLMAPQQVVRLDEAKNLKKKKKPSILHPSQLHKLFEPAPPPEGFTASPPPAMEDPGEHLKNLLLESGWTVGEKADDLQGEPPEFPDDLPPPDDSNDVDEGELDEDGEGAYL